MLHFTLTASSLEQEEGEAAPNIYNIWLHRFQHATVTSKNLMHKEQTLAAFKLFVFGQPSESSDKDLTVQQPPAAKN